MSIFFLSDHGKSHIKSDCCCYREIILFEANWDVFLFLKVNIQWVYLHVLVWYIKIFISYWWLWDGDFNKISHSSNLLHLRLLHTQHSSNKSEVSICLQSLSILTKDMRVNYFFSSIINITFKGNFSQKLFTTIIKYLIYIFLVKKCFDVKLMKL